MILYLCIPAVIRLKSPPPQVTKQVDWESVINLVFVDLRRLEGTHQRLTEFLYFFTQMFFWLIECFFADVQDHINKLLVSEYVSTFV